MSRRIGSQAKEVLPGIRIQVLSVFNFSKYNLNLKKGAKNENKTYF
jgi:hypothetical protein